MKLLIYTESRSPRLRYVLDFLFGRLLSCSYRLTSDEAGFASSALPRISYGRRRIGKGALHLPSCGLLEAAPISPQALRVCQHDGLPAFFRCTGDDSADLPFDLFALAFYLLSRYEEYLPFQPDRHRRFPASESLAGRFGFLQRPLVDLWTLRLGDLLQRRFPGWSYQTPSFRFLPTYDVDLAWAFHHRGWLRQAGGTLRQLASLDLEGLQLRLSVLREQRPDPFYTFPFLDELHRKYELDARYFFLLADRGRYDLNPSPRQPQLRALIRQLSRHHRTGIHPSYRSNDQPDLLAREIGRLEDITGQPVRDSRQHFLRLRLPDTYRRLLAAGIRTDYSMGYADAAGFRAGTAHPFFWYDLQREAATTLRVVPFQVMDGTLKNYLRLRPEQALEHLAPIIAESRKTGGYFCTLWHNSSFSSISGWKGWKPVYEELVRQLAG